MDDKARIHATYILCILCTVIVGLITVEWSSIPRLPELITFALTVSSLILALLAIVYAYVSNFSSQQTTAKLTIAAETIVHSAEDVRRATNALGVQVSDIPKLVSSVADRVDQTHALIKDYAAKQASHPPLAATPDKPDEQHLGIHDRFLQTSSLSGLFVLFMFKWHMIKKRSLNLPDVLKKTGGITPDYAYGFLIASASAGLIEFSHGSNMEIMPTGLNADISRNLEGQIPIAIRNTFADEPTRSEYGTKFENLKKYLESQ